VNVPHTDIATASRVSGSRCGCVRVRWGVRTLGGTECSSPSGLPRFRRRPFARSCPLLSEESRVDGTQDPMDLLIAGKHHHPPLITDGLAMCRQMRGAVPEGTESRIDDVKNDVQEGSASHALFRRYYAARRVNVNESTGSPYIGIALEKRTDIPLFALVDSGATHSVIGASVLQALIEAVGAEEARKWPRHKTTMHITLADGKEVTPKGAILLQLGMQTVRKEYVWTHFPFLVLDNVVDGIILGTDWETEVSATRFPPSRVIGISLTQEARATYQEWSAHVTNAGAITLDVPAYAFTHALPFVSKVAAVAFGKRVIATDATPALAPPMSQPVAEATSPGAEANRSKARKVRWKLRSLHAVTIPPLSEVGPVSVSIDDGGAVRPQ